MASSPFVQGTQTHLSKTSTQTSKYSRSTSHLSLRRGRRPQESLEDASALATGIEALNIHTVATSPNPFDRTVEKEHQNWGKAPPTDLPSNDFARSGDRWPRPCGPKKKIHPKRYRRIRCGRSGERTGKTGVHLGGDREARAAYTWPDEPVFTAPETHAQRFVVKKSDQVVESLGAIGESKRMNDGSEAVSAESFAWKQMQPVGGRCKGRKGSRGYRKGGHAPLLPSSNHSFSSCGSYTSLGSSSKTNPPGPSGRLEHTIDIGRVPRRVCLGESNMPAANSVEPNGPTKNCTTLAKGGSASQSTALHTYGMYAQDSSTKQFVPETLSKSALVKSSPFVFGAISRKTHGKHSRSKLFTPACLSQTEPNHCEETAFEENSLDLEQENPLDCTETELCVKPESCPLANASLETSSPQEDLGERTGSPVWTNPSCHQLAGPSIIDLGNAQAEDVFGAANNARVSESNKEMAWDSPGSTSLYDHEHREQFKLVPMDIDLSAPKIDSTKSHMPQFNAPFRFECPNEVSHVHRKKIRKWEMRRFRKKSAPRTESESKAVAPDYVVSAEEESQKLKKIKEAEETGNRFKDLANAKFRTEDYTDAEALYTRGITAAQECSASKIQPLLAILLANRAAARLMLKMPKEALEDCEEAMRIHPKYIKAHIRCANCLIQSGEFGKAISVMDHALEMLSADDKQYASLAQKASDARGFSISLKDMKQFLAQSSSTSGKAREAVMKVYTLASVASLSEEVQRIMVSVLMKSGMYDEVIEQVTRLEKELRVEELGHQAVIWWKWMRAQARWQKQGELDASIKETKTLLVLMERHNITSLKCPLNTGCSANLDEIKGFVQSVSEAGRLKEQGNREVKGGKYGMAVETYTNALQIAGQCGAPAHLVAVYYSNRGSAYYGLKKYAEAIGDCCWARALSKGYARPLSRLADLFVDTRQPTSGIVALKQMLDCTSLSCGEKQTVQSRISDLEKFAKTNPIPNYYRILGLQESCTVLDVKKAYRMLALRFHPDKAIVSCRFNCRLGHSGVDYVKYGEMCQGVREEANWLFKTMNEANAVLLDSEKRQNLDAELMDQRSSSLTQKNRWEANYSANASGSRNNAGYQRSWHAGDSFVQGYYGHQHQQYERNGWKWTGNAYY